MLSVLKIQNIAIIESAEIEFSEGFNVLSGETGAGKSIILDSINAVLGFRTSRELIRTGESEAQVTALFSCVGENVNNKLKALGLPVSDDDTLLVSRVISADRNVCRVNNALVNVTVLRDLGTELISIHGQQDNRDLLNEETHISYIDAMSSADDLLSEYKSTYEELSLTKAKIKRLSGEKSEKARKADILAFQIKEIEDADINPGEWENLKNRRSELQNYEKIQEGLYGAFGALSGDDSFHGAVELVSGAYKELSSIAQYSRDVEELSEKLGNLYYELEDIADSVRGCVSDEGYSREELESVENRINTIYNLSKKYGDTEDEILLFLEKAKQEYDEISFSDEKLEELKVLCEKQQDKAMSLAEKLSEKRQKTALDFSKKVCDELRFLDMPNVEFVVDFKKIELSDNGIDEVKFLISANLGEIPKPIAKIASGGELSRIMLAFKTVMANKDKINTMVFDEIDAGVSGRAALKVASKLKEVSVGKQVLCVTHLAQLMSYADSHYLIEKATDNGKTYTSVTPLDITGRKNEIARIISGGKITETQLKNAEEMLTEAKAGVGL
ncbi:MAG: DNA repair protein RecN [Clostridia bacterium]|nr:DNA repair protein RecN [Clostridia bacterium]